MKLDYGNLRRRMDLLWILTRKEIILQYKRTSLGILWSLLNPLLLAFVFYIAFSVILGVRIMNFPLFILSALFPWTWFSTSVSASTVSLISNRSLVRKFPFPKHYLLLGSVFSQGVHFLFSIPIIIFLVYLYHKSAGLIWFAGVPMLLLIQVIMTIGISLPVSVINVYFTDFQFIVGFLLQVLFWMTPIVYRFDTIPQAYRTLFLYMNPMTSLMNSWRELFMSSAIHWNSIATSCLDSLLIFFVGLILYRKLGKRIDEVI